jgi:hypothetical protein
MLLKPFLGYRTHSRLLMVEPWDIKFLRQRIYVSCPNLSLSGMEHAF